jgi:hypothetical protein
MSRVHTTASDPPKIDDHAAAVKLVGLIQAQLAALPTADWKTLQALGNALRQLTDPAANTCACRYQLQDGTPQCIEVTVDACNSIGGQPDPTSHC